MVFYTSEVEIGKRMEEKEEDNRHDIIRIFSKYSAGIHGWCLSVV